MTYLYIIILVVVVAAIVTFIFSKSSQTAEKERTEYIKKLARLDELKKKKAEIEIARKKKYEEDVRLLAEKYGNPDKLIVFAENDIDNEIRAYSSCGLVAIMGKEYGFSSILECKLTDNSTTEHGEVIITSTGSATTSNSSMIGRAVVGSLVAGPAGAIIGGSTAKQNTSSTSVVNQGDDTTRHDYTVWITIKDIANPMVKIHIGKDADKANEIVALMSAIIASKE